MGKCFGGETQSMGSGALHLTPSCLSSMARGRVPLKEKPRPATCASGTSGVLEPTLQCPCPEQLDRGWGFCRAGSFDSSIPLLSNDILKSECSESFLSPAEDLIKDPETGSPKRSLTPDQACPEKPPSLMRPARLQLILRGLHRGASGGLLIPGIFV